MSGAAVYNPTIAATAWGRRQSSPKPMIAPIARPTLSAACSMSRSPRWA